MTSRIFRNAFPLSLGLSLVLLAVACLCFPSIALAQRSAAAINGTVSDPSGAVIPGATVTLRNTQTAIERTTVTNETGSYVFVDVLPGRYTLKVGKEGFNTATQPEFEIYVNQTATFNISLNLGSALQTVTVEAVASSIQASTAELGTAITTRAVNDLPLNGRNFTQLLALTPGVSPISVAQNGGGGGGFAGRAIGTFTFPSVHGQRNRSNFFLVDGVNDLGSFIGNYNVEPILESLQEFKVQSHNDLAEFGQALGGIVNVVTKPGTNDFHGSVWEFLRNEKLDARNFFFKARNPLRQNQFGASGGGPIIIPRYYNGRNKTFFFGGYEGFRQSVATESLLKTPTPAELSGDFSKSGVTIFNPFSTRPDPNNPGKFIRDPFDGNKIQPNLINQAALLYAKTLFPSPVDTGNPNFNLLDNTPQITGQDTFHLRLDEQAGVKNSLFGRFSYYNQVSAQSAGYPGARQKVFLHGYNIAAHETHTFGPTAVLDIHFGRNWGQDNIIKVFDNGSASFIQQLQQVGFSPNFNGNFRAAQGPFVPLINIGGFLTTGGNNVQATRIADIWEFGGDFTKIRGRHTIKFGMNFASNNTQSPIFGVSEAFTAVPTAGPLAPGGTGGSPFASFLLGLPDNGGRRNVLETEHGGWIDGWYIQDQWKATDKLTVNFGFRYDVTFWPIYGDFKNEEIFVGDLNLNDGSFVLAAVPPPCGPGKGEPCIPGGILPAHVVPTTAGNNSIYHNNHDNWQGRLGFAYRLFPKTVVRAAYGRFYDNWNSIIQLAQNYEGAWPRVGQLLAQNLNQSVPNTAIGDPFNLGSSAILPAPTPFLSAGFVLWYVDPFIKMPYSDQWNLGFEHQLTSDTVLSLNYVGSHSSRLNLGAFRNTAVTPGPGDRDVVASRRPFPYIPPTFYDQSIGRANYNAFEFRLDKKASKGLSYLISYTWSKSIDIACSGNFGAEGCAVQNAYNLNAERSVSGYDVTHLFIASWVYELPFGKGKRFSSSNPVVNALAANWQINGILTLTSGVPYHVVVSGDIANTGSNHERPNLVGNPNPPNRTPSNWLNKDAFKIPDAFTFGNLGRNSLRSDRIKNLDLSIFRRFPIKESMGLEFRAEAFNFTNTPVFNPPANNKSNPNFGVVSSTRNQPRQIQFALKFYF